MNIDKWKKKPLKKELYDIIKLQEERISKLNKEKAHIEIAYEEDYKEQQQEIKRLNNIINELEKELQEDYKIWMCNSRSNGKSVKFGIDVCKTHFYNRLQELKEVIKSER